MRGNPSQVRETRSAAAQGEDAAAGGRDAAGVPPGNRPTRLRDRLARFMLGSQRMRELISFQVSLVAHCLLMLALALIWMHDDSLERVALTISPVDASEAPPVVFQQTLDANLFETESTSSLQLAQQPTAAPDRMAVPMPLAVHELGGMRVEPRELVEAVPANELLLISEAPSGGGLEGRSLAERARLARARGGSAASEEAVEMGLAWLAAHQRQDGSWRLNHQDGPCAGRCPDPGRRVETPIGATGLALLPFLGAGYTHQQGKYQDVVDAGLRFLISQMKTTQHEGDLHWDTTVGGYAQGIATLALCEAYAMTEDPSLAPFAQQAVGFVCFAQHPRGGWRYKVAQPGDTTVTAWQVMALKSARLGRLQVPSLVLERVDMYLNSVQGGRGAFYGYRYTQREVRPSTTAIGLLLRMYLGWTRQDDRLRRGAYYLSDLGPSQSDMYYNFYATQVLHHLGEPFWEKWNRVMRDQLVHTQATEGHQRGSWYVHDTHGSAGGRHYTTAMCTMILEVYYRYMPLYGEGALREAF